MARPKKSREERLTERIRFRVRPSDFLHGFEAAEKAGMPISAFARELFLHGRVVIKQTRQLDHATYDQLRRIGVNLNQLTHLANATKRMPASLPPLCAQIEQFLTEHIAHDIVGHEEGP